MALQNFELISRVNQLINGRIQENGLMKLVHISSAFTEAGLDRSVYMATGPKKWITDNFPEFVIEGSNGKETIVPAKDPVAAMDKILRDALRTVGRILLSHIPGLLEAHGYRYKEYAQGQRLSEWLEETFPGLGRSEDNLWLMDLTGGTPVIVAQEEEESAESVKETQQMHTAAFMNGWNAKIKNLRTDKEKLPDEETIKLSVAHHFAYGLLGMPDSLTYVEEDRRAAFKTGLKNGEGEPVYCVLDVNPDYDGKKQAWALWDFACAGDSTPAGQWLRGVVVQTDRAQRTFAELKNISAQVENSFREIGSLLAQYHRDIAAGKLPGTRIGEAVSGFERLVDEFTSLYATVLGEVYPAEQTVEQVAEQLNERNVVSQQVGNAVEKFCQIAQQVHELLVKNRFPVKGESTPQKDIAQLRTQYNEFSADGALNTLEKKLPVYQALMQVMAAPTCTAEIENLAVAVSDHFTEISYRNAVRILVDSGREDWAFMEPLEGIGQTVLSCREQLLTASAAEAERPEISADELFQKVSTCGGDGIALARYASQILPESTVERMLVFSQLEELKQHLASRQDQIPNGEELAEKLDKRALPEELTYYAAAVRLQEMSEGYEELAEKYYILGLALDSVSSANALLDLYRKREDKARFAAVFTGYAKEEDLTPENREFYLSVLCDEGSEGALEYAYAHYYMFYKDSSAQHLCRLPDDVLSAAEKEQIRERIARTENYVNLNELEQAILEGDRAKITALAADPGKLMALGYTDEQITRINQGAASISEADRGKDTYSIGVRFYQYQKDLHGLAEGYMWAAIAQDPNVVATELMLLLAQQMRFAECCKLYECYQKVYSKNAGCRRLYLLSRLRLDPGKAVEYIRANLPDTLQQMNEMPLIKATVNTLVSQQEESSGFYAEMIRLSELMEDPLIKAVVLQDRTLREYATPSYVKELGIQEKYVTGILNTYRAESYPHGIDALSIASRIFVFCGAYTGAAEAFAKLALPDPQAVTLLWEIYAELGDENLLFDMLDEYPKLRNAHMEQYLDGLFRRQRFADFLAEYEKGAASPTRQLQRYIAALKTDTQPLPAMPDLELEEPSAMDSWFTLWGSQLIAVLAETGHREQIEDLLLHFFDGWLSRLEEKTVKTILTGNGTVSAQILGEIQNSAVESHNDALALYIFNVLKIGQLEDLAKEFLDRENALVQQLPSDQERLTALLRIKAIFGEEAETVDGRIALLQIRQMLRDESLPLEQIAQRTAQTLEQWEGKQELLGEVTALVKDSAVCCDESVCRSLESIVRTEEERDLILRYFHDIAASGRAAGKDRFMQFVCRQYVYGFMGGYFPEELLQQAYTLCYDHVIRAKSVESRYSLYFLEQAMGKTHHAKLILREMAELPSDVLGEEISNSLTAQMAQMWNNSLPSFLTLFKDLLEECSLEQILDFITYAGKVSDYSAESISHIQSQLAVIAEDRILSEAESDELIRLLYVNAADGETWKMLPKLSLPDNPLCYAKICILTAEYMPEIWEKGAELCRKYGLNDLLLTCLIRWSESVPVERINECREYIEQRLEEDNTYLSQWNVQEESRAKLLRLSQTICNRVKVSEAEFHATVRAICLIAEKTGIPEAMTYLYDRYGRTLLSRNCNLAVVTAVYLLLDKRFQEARHWLGLLKDVLENMNYRGLVDQLAQMDEQELEQWLSKSKNAITLQLILPDGNRPNIDRITAITYEGILQNNAAEISEVLLGMLEVFPDDYGLYNSLYDLCCTKFAGYLPVLHKTLRGLSRLNPSAGAFRFYRREQSQYVRMLAVLDGVIVFRKQTDAIEGYDFTLNTGNYYRMIGAANTTASEVLAINDVRDQVLARLQSVGKQSAERLCDAYVSLLTGNWREFLAENWNSRRNIREELELSLEKIDDLGFARSMLYVLTKVEPGQRDEFVQWVKENGQVTENTLFGPRSKRQEAIAFVERFYQAEGLERIRFQEQTDILPELIETPFEDFSLMNQYFLRYINYAIKSNEDCLYELIFLTSGLVCHYRFQNEVYEEAQKMFENGNDLQASRIYRAIYEHCRVFGTVHVEAKGAIVRKIRESYEAKYRLSALFAGDREMAEKVASPDFHMWSCINLVTTLLYSSRADELLRLAGYFSADNAKLAKALLAVMSSTEDDWSKLDLETALPNDVFRAHFCFVAKYPYNPYAKTGVVSDAAFLKDKEVAQKFNERYVELARLPEVQSSGAFNNLKPSHTLLVENRPIHPRAAQQKDPALWHSRENEETEEKSKNDLHLPFYAQDLKPDQTGREDEKLLAEYGQITRSGANITEKLALSREILEIRLAKPEEEEALTEALLLYGCDSYYGAQDEEDEKLAHRILFALAKLARQSPRNTQGYEEAKLLLPNGLHGMIKSFTDLSDLVDSYFEHKSLYLYLRSCVGDPLQSSCVGTIYEVLDNLRGYYASATHEDPEVLREALSVNYRKMETIEANRWMDLKNKVQKLINDEIYGLDRRPMFQVEVLNLGVQRHTGYLYGKIRNIGQIAAENLILQANYNNDSHSQQYVLDYLSPGAQAVFQIDYSCSPDAEAMEYFVNLSFMFEGKVFSSVASKGRLKIGQIPEPEYPVISADPNGLIFSVDEETGEVYNPDFVGRKNETADLKKLLTGGSFAMYKSAMVYGIRRSGKSSLLNYLAAYMRANFADIICVQLDCQALPNENCIQYVFVDSVLRAVEVADPVLATTEEWEALKKLWGDKNFCADQNIQALTQFYPAVKRLLGKKGIYLIIDEIDRLFERVEGSLDSLFGVLSAMLTTAECRSSVHFVICGSNWLIRYNLLGDNKNQLLQRFGEQVIEVGKLPENDAKDVVTLPYRDYPELIITPEALNWIWNYTGGLVWHTKLLGNTAIQLAKKAGRYVVYPSDVRNSVPEVISDQWCKQFYEGCESGNEFKLVDAMQSLTARRNAYVHISQLCELLGWESLEVQRVLSILRALRVVSPDPVDAQKYRFEMDIYRRYFRSTPSNYTRIPEEPDTFRRRQIQADQKAAANASAVSQPKDDGNSDAQDDAFGDL